jgi:hypothetical protein
MQLKCRNVLLPPETALMLQLRGPGAPNKLLGAQPSLLRTSSPVARASRGCSRAARGTAPDRTGH